MKNTPQKSERKDILNHLYTAIKEKNKDDVNNYSSQFKKILTQSKNQKLSSKEEQKIKDIAFSYFDKGIINTLNKNLSINWLKINKIFPFYIRNEHQKDIKDSQSHIKELFSWIFDENNEILTKEDVEICSRDLLEKSCFANREPFQYINNPLIHFIRNALLNVIPDNLLSKQDKEQNFINGFHNGMKSLYLRNFDNFKSLIDDFIKFSGNTKFKQLVTQELNYFLPDKNYAKSITKNNIEVWQHIYFHNDILKEIWNNYWINNKEQNSKINKNIDSLNKTTSFQNLPHIKEILLKQKSNTYNKENNNIPNAISYLFDNYFVDDLYKYARISIQASNNKLSINNYKLENNNLSIFDDNYFSFLNERELNLSTLILFLSYKDHYQNKKYNFDNYQKKCPSIFSYILKNSGSYIKDFLEDNLYVEQINESIKDNHDEIINFCIKSNINTFSYAYKKLDNLKTYKLDNLNIIDIWLIFTKEKISYEIINHLSFLSKDFSDTLKENKVELNNYLFGKLKNKEEINQLKRLIIKLNIPQKARREVKKKKF